METKYSKTQFEGFTHRFKVQFETDEPHSSSLDIYSNSDSYQKLDDFICIRNRDMDTLRYLVEKKGLDLYEIDKSPFELWTDEKPSEHVSPYFHLHLTTFLYRLLEELLMSNYDSSLEKCEKPDKYCKFFGEMFDYINLKFPDLKIKTTAEKKTINKSDAISGVLKEAFGTHDYNEKQIENIQKLLFK